MNDLQVVVKQVPGTISFNFEEIKQQAVDYTKKYTSLVLTEEDVASAKKDRAELNSKFKELEAERIAAEKKFMEPLADFKSKVKEIGVIISDASISMDKQIKIFEDAEIEAKKIEITNIYNEIVTDIQDYIPLVKIYNSKWENKGTKIKAIREEIQTLYDSTKLSIDSINNMQSEKVQEALVMFQKDLNLNNAISFINRFEAEKARILEVERKKQQEETERKQREEDARIRKENEDRIRQQEREKIAAEQRIRDEEKQRIEAEETARIEVEKKASTISANRDVYYIPASPVETPISFEGEKPFETEEAFVTEKPFEVFRSPIYTSTLRVSTTELGHDALKNFMVSANISYEEI